MEWNYYNWIGRRTKVKWTTRILRNYVVWDKLNESYPSQRLSSICRSPADTYSTHNRTLSPCLHVFHQCHLLPSVLLLPPSFFFPHGLCHILSHSTSTSSYAKLLGVLCLVIVLSPAALFWDHRTTEPQWIIIPASAEDASTVDSLIFPSFLCFSLLIISSEIWSRKEDNNTQEDFSGNTCNQAWLLVISFFFFSHLQQGDDWCLVRSGGK